jgi:hypothetical protein
MAHALSGFLHRLPSVASNPQRRSLSFKAGKKRKSAGSKANSIADGKGQGQADFFRAQAAGK